MIKKSKYKKIVTQAKSAGKSLAKDDLANLDNDFYGNPEIWSQEEWTLFVIKVCDEYRDQHIMKYNKLLKTGTGE